VSTDPVARTSERPPSFDFDRSPFLVLWEVTRACDLACRHCRAEAQHEPLPDELSTAEAMEVLDEVREIGDPLVVITGGDPMKRSDILDLVRYGAMLGLRMTMTPSGTPLMTADRVRALKDAGLSRLAVSLDAPTADAHDGFRGVPGSFGWTLDCIAHAHDVDLPVQINTTMCRYNADDFDRLVDLMSQLDIVLWSVFFLVPTGRGQTDDVLEPTVCEALLERLHGLSGKVPFDIKTTAAPFYRRVAMQKGVEARRAEVSSTGQPVRPGAHRTKIGSGRAPAGVTDGRGVLFVACNGEVYPSGFLPVSAGNIREQSLASIYRDSPLFQALRDPDALLGKCGSCEFKRVCGGSRARAFAVYDDYLQADPSCAYQPPGWTSVPDNGVETASAPGTNGGPLPPGPNGGSE